MVKKISLFLLSVLGLSALIFPSTKFSASAANQEDYVVSSFSGVPSDWTLDTTCDTANVTATVVDTNDLSIAHTSESNPGYSKYYGAHYMLANDETFTDFTFKMTFKMTSAITTSRWFGILYHTQKVGNNTIGYLMNYRQNGNSASSAVNSGREFFDDTAKSVTSLIGDTSYHILKIVMEGNISRHYMDNTLITSWDVSSKNTNLSLDSYLTSGGFSLIINQSTIQIDKVEISHTPEEGPKTDLDIVDTYVNSSDAVSLPTVIQKDTNLSELSSLVSNTKLPSNIIFDVNDSGLIYDKNNNLLTILDAYKTLNKKVIPIFRIESTGSLNRLNLFLANQVDLLDTAVLSSDISLLKTFKNKHKVIRTIYEVKDTTDLAGIVKTANTNLVHTLLIDSSLISQEEIFYIQARFKTVWLDNIDTNSMAIHRGITSGAYGLVTNDYLNVYSLFSKYDSNAMLRPQFNVAHRGLASKYNENSLTGIKASLEAGATHVEIDAYLTKDQDVVIMHDATLDAATNGTGNVEDMTMAEIKQYQLDLFTPYDEIPSLDQVITLFEDYPSAVMILEIKSPKTAIVEVIKQKLTAANFLDNVVFISFNKDQLSKLNSVLPEIPKANLHKASEDNFSSVLNDIATYNSAVDTSISYATEKLNNMLKARGFIGWYWTYTDAASIEFDAKPNGFTGVTNDICDYYSDKVFKVTGRSFKLKQNDILTDIDVLVDIVSYDGTTSLSSKGKVVDYLEYDEYFEVISSYQYDFSYGNVPSEIYYTEPYRIYKDPNGTHLPVKEKITLTPVFEAGDDASDKSLFKYDFDHLTHTPKVKFMNGDQLVEDVPYKFHYTHQDVFYSNSAPKEIGWYALVIELTDQENYLGLSTGGYSTWKVFEIRDTVDAFTRDWQALRNSGTNGLCSALESEEGRSELTALIERYDNASFKSEVATKEDTDGFTIGESVEYFRSRLNTRNISKFLQNRIISLENGAIMVTIPIALAMLGFSVFVVFKKKKRS